MRAIKYLNYVEVNGSRPGAMATANQTVARRYSHVREN
jgi:hypothetical protein